MTDPFEKLLDFMRDQGKHYNLVPPAVGSVLSVSPLRILFGGVSLDDEDLDVNKSLVTHEGYTFKTGSRVLILPTDNEFIVLCEVI